MHEKFLSAEQKQKVALLITQTFNKNDGLKLVAIATIDGFNIHTESIQELDIEVDKLAAMSSALCSLGNAAAEQLIKDHFNMTTVETAHGNILLLRTEFYNLSCVISMVADDVVLLAEARFLIQRLAGQVADIS